jgi:hypothetical protein
LKSSLSLYYQAIQPGIDGQFTHTIWRRPEIIDGVKYTIIKHTESGKKSTLPRHNPVDKNLLKDFVEEYLVEELGILEKEIYKYLWC